MLDWWVTFPSSLQIGKFPIVSSPVSHRNRRQGTNSHFKGCYPAARTESLPEPKARERGSWYHPWVVIRL